jgi:type I restriction enzyme S subunit
VNSAHGSVFDTITTSTFEASSVLLPNPRAAEAFDNIARSKFNKLLKNLHESQTLANLRDTLLPKLLSGELRVPEAEKQVEEVV